jgi:class 3 adenylate cyclase
VRDQRQRFRGREVNTTGDDFVVSFDGLARAITCAQALVDATVDLGLDIRVGLHTDECEFRGDDLGGLAVHIAARVMDLAGLGEVRVSSTVKNLVLGSGIEFADRGEHDLKGRLGLRGFCVEATRPGCPLDGDAVVTHHRHEPGDGDEDRY